MTKLEGTSDWPQYAKGKKEIPGFTESIFKLENTESMFKESLNIRVPTFLNIKLEREEMPVLNFNVG